MDQPWNSKDLSPAMRILYLLLLLAPLAACSYTTYLTNADEHGGTINLVTELSRDSALEKANAHCRQYNLVARIISSDPASNSMTFACQPAPDTGKTGS
jgi:hypothetical protein